MIIATYTVDVVEQRLVTYRHSQTLLASSGESASVQVQKATDYAWQYKLDGDARFTVGPAGNFTEQLALLQRLAYPDAGELLTLEDYRNIARNLIAKEA